jgi:hypothetical protein
MDVQSIRRAQSTAERFAGILFSVVMIVISTGFTVGYLFEWIGGG